MCICLSANRSAALWQVAIQMLKQIVAHQVIPSLSPKSSLNSESPTRFWQPRYYDFNIWTAKKRKEKLCYLHRNPVKRGLVEKQEDWAWSSFRHYLTGIEGVVEIESEWTGRRRERMGLPLRVKIVPTLSPESGDKGRAPTGKSDA